MSDVEGCHNYSELRRIKDCFLSSQAEEPCITSDHISELIGCLRENIRSPDKRLLTNSLLTLRSSLLNSSVPLSSLQAVLFSFQDAVCFFVFTLVCYKLKTEGLDSFSGFYLPRTT